MADEQSQQTGAVTGGDSTTASGGTAAPINTPIVPATTQSAQQPSPKKENTVDDLLSMWASDDIAIGETNPQVKPAQLDKPAPVVAVPTPAPEPALVVATPSAAVPLPPQPLPVVSTAPQIAPSLVTPTPIAPLPPRPILQTVPVVPTLAPQAPRPVAPNPPVTVSAPTPSPLPPRPIAPTPTAHQPLSPIPTSRPVPPPGPIPPKPNMPVAPTQSAAPISVAPQPPRPMPQTPVAPQAPVLAQPQVAPMPPRPVQSTPVTPQPPRPVAPAQPVFQPAPPVPQPPRPAPVVPTPSVPVPPRPQSGYPASGSVEPPRPQAPTPVAPQPPRPQTPPVAPAPPRPVQPVQAPAPQAPRPAPAPMPARPEPVKKIDKQEAIEAEFIEEDDDASALAAADLLSSIKKKEDVPSIDDGEGFIAQVKELINELGITPAKIVRLIIYIAVFIGLVYAIHLAWVSYGGVILQKVGLGGSNSQTEQTPRPVPKQPTENTIDSGIAGSVQVGQGIAAEPIYITDIGVQAGIAIGEAARAVTPFAKYITQFKLLENAYQVDINKLLNQSTDRRARLKSQLLLMNQLYKEANETLGDVQQEIDITNSELTKRTAQQTTTETAFFAQMTALNGQVAEGLLSDFTRTAQQVVTLKARYRALQRLQTLYTNALPRFERRIRDLELNQEPLISGLKIYDVAGSDLELIVPVQDSGAPIRSSSSPIPTSGRTGIVPIISPQEFKDVSGTDYITAPGGGF